MTTPTSDPRHFDQKARRIRVRAATILTKWGLLPRFKRWRLTQDSDTGMVVLFGVLNKKYIGTHTSIPFSNYFDPRLLHDLENELQVQVVSCNSDGLRYAFILDRGSVGKLPSHINFPILDGDRLLVGVVYDNRPESGWVKVQGAPAPTGDIGMADDQTLVRRGVGAFLKVFDDIKLRDDVALRLAAQKVPDIVLIGEDEFNKRVVEYEADRQRINRIRKL